MLFRKIRKLIADHKADREFFIDIKDSPPFVLPPKDPMDWKLTKNSKAWWSDTYCPTCKSHTKHEEYMSRICNSCGNIFENITDLMQHRANRKIWNGEKWVLQRKYGNGKSEYTLEDC